MELEIPFPALEWIAIYAEGLAQRYGGFPLKTVLIRDLNKSNIGLSFGVDADVGDQMLDEAIEMARRSFEDKPLSSAWTTRNIGAALGVTLKERKEGFTHLGCFEETDKQRDVRRKAEKKIKDAARYKKSTKSFANKEKPWMLEGISRATWYRRLETLFPRVISKKEILSCEKSVSTAFINGSGSAIGSALAERLERDGWQIVGRMGHDPLQVREPGPWNLFISAVGTLEPVGKFLDVSIDAWKRSFEINFFDQLRVLHQLWPYRSPGPVDIMFFAGGGSNTTMPGHSAYCLAKVCLVKMCEIIHAEEPDANCFIIGPGFVRTPIHKGNIPERFKDDPGTSMDDIYDHMRWCMEQGREIAGGRNFSTVHDRWRKGGFTVIDNITLNEKDAYRLRRVE